MFKIKNSLVIYDNEKFGKIRGLMIDGNPYFVGKDVAQALGFKGKGANNAIKAHVDEEDKGVTEIVTPGGKQAMTLINESGLYSLILSSKLPTAKEFKRWVTSEVLPSIRKTGAYFVDKDVQAIINARLDGKKMRRQETDAIKLFIEYARSQGCTWQDFKFYSNLSIICNLGVGLPQKNGRNSATKNQLMILGTLEGTTIPAILRQGIIDDLHWTQIWAKVQQQINIFLQVTFQGRLPIAPSNNVVVSKEE